MPSQDFAGGNSSDISPNRRSDSIYNSLILPPPQERHASRHTTLIPRDNWGSNNIWHKRLTVPEVLENTSIG